MCLVDNSTAIPRPTGCLALSLALSRPWKPSILGQVPERDDQIAHRRKRPGRPIDFGDDQRERYKDRNVVERCFNFVKQWRGLASRYDKTARSYAAGLCLSAALQWN